jgi:copper resistance protein B
MKMKKIFEVLAMSSLIMPVFADMGDDPILGKVMIDQLEIRSTEGDDPVVLEADAWIGKDLHKAWFKADVERVDGETEQAEVQARYSRAVAPYWDFQLGWRHDLEPDEETRDWAVLGLRGLAPYFFDIDAALYVGENGRTQLSFDTEYEMMLTQRWVLSPELQVNLYGKSDPVLGQGSGLSDLELGLRLRYEIKREFAPYIGVNLESKFGGTADFAKDEGEDSSDVQFVAGIRAWF